MYSTWPGFRGRILPAENKTHWYILRFILPVAYTSHNNLLKIASKKLNNTHLNSPISYTSLFHHPATLSLTPTFLPASRHKTMDCECTFKYSMKCIKIFFSYETGLFTTYYLHEQFSKRAFCTSHFLFSTTVTMLHKR